MEFNYFNPNPDASTFKSGKPKNWNRKDSCIRAICKITDNSWDKVYEDLYKISKNYHNMVDSKEVIDTYLQQMNFDYQTYGKPEVGQKRPTVEEFVNNNHEGTFVLYLRDYYVTIIDGILYNTDTIIKDASVYSYWELK